VPGFPADSFTPMHVTCFELERCKGIRLSTKVFSHGNRETSAAENANRGGWTRNHGWNQPDSRPLSGAAFLSDMVSRIPDESRFATLTEAPNKERMRYATGGPSPRSPLGVSVSSTEKISKNFGRAVVGIVLPRLSMITVGESATT
jgi:hypothetical protein